MALWSLIQTTEDYVMIKFDDSIKASTLVNANFTLTNDDATPASVVASPFRTINLTTDYVSVSRTLYLWWNISLQPNTTYSIHMSNLKHAITGATIPTSVYTFDTAGSTTTPDVTERPTREPIDVEDYSIKNPPAVDSGDGGGPSLPGDASTLTIVSVTPDVNAGFYLESGEFDGKIVVEFNQPPAANFITLQDFRLQKRLITTGIAKWENVDTVVAAESTEPKVNIYLPSNDATPIYSYMTAGEHEYWLAGYQYRLIISKNVGI